MGNKLKYSNNRHSNANFIERLASIDGKNNGIPPSKFLMDQPYLYVLNISNWITSIEKYLTSITLIKKAILTPPPNYWLENIGMGLDDFYKEKAELFVISVTSSVDGILHLINAVYLSPLKGRDINPKKLKNLTDNDSLNECIDHLMNTTREIRIKRNSLVHDLESPRVKILSDIRRMKLVINSFKMPKDNLSYNYDEGIKIFIDELDEYSNALNSIFENVCNNLVDLYEDNVRALGGIREPSIKEREIAKSVLEYFDGGDKPAHW